MQTIHLHHPYSKTDIYSGPIVLALGFFDGLHKGHQQVIKTAKKIATKRSLPLAAMTFDVSATVMYQQKHPDEVQYLTTLSTKEKLMAHFGVDILYVAQMTSAFAKQTPQRFVEDYIVNLNAKVVAAGYDYTYGQKDLANMATLPEHADGRFAVIEVPRMEINNQKVGSTQIRQLILNGDIEQANQSLGYHYFFGGSVIHGEKRGRELGFPTANLRQEPNVIVPKTGVYIVEFVIANELYWGIASIGRNITFGENRKRTVEIHVLDFNEEIYGEKVTVFWHKYLRSEMKFNGADELIAQMRLDEINTRQYIAGYNHSNLEI